jgi:retron-type reverse transcriptase
LLHHVNAEALERAFHRLKRGAAAGVDGETVATYEQGLPEKLQALCDRVHRGAYRPEPVRRVHIPKPDGGQRPLGIPALEDKIVQGAVAELLSAIYEVDFLGFSYGFRPGRSPHLALRALHTALMTQYVNWVLDADIRRFFDSVNHEWLLRMVAHRVADPESSGSSADGCGPARSMGTCGPKRSKVRRKARASARYWRTSSCTTRWTCGSTSGEGGMRAVAS